MTVGISRLPLGLLSTGLSLQKTCRKHGAATQQSTPCCVKSAQISKIVASTTDASHQMALSSSLKCSETVLGRAKRERTPCDSIESACKAFR